MMVQVAEPDRDVLRFLWVDDPNSDSPKVIVKRFNRIVFGPIVNVDDIFRWTDSKTTLCWIQEVDKELKQFVENRVKEIRDKVSPEHWNHCPGKDNPADIPLHGSRADVLKQSKKWWNGPT